MFQESRKGSGRGNGGGKKGTIEKGGGYIPLPLLPQTRHESKEGKVKGGIRETGQKKIYPLEQDTSIGFDEYLGLE